MAAQRMFRVDLEVLAGSAALHLRTATWLSDDK